MKLSTSLNKEKKKYDILLVSVQRFSLATHSKKADGLNRLPPLGLMYLSSYLNKNGFKTKILDMLPNRLDEIIHFIEKCNIKVVGFTTCTATINLITTFLRKNSEIFSQKIVILGGTHVSAMPKSTLRKIDDIDFVVVGEGEKILSDLLKNLKKINYKKSDISKIRNRLNRMNGLCYRIGNNIRINKIPNTLKNLDEIPIPKRKGMANYVPPPNQYKKLPVAHIISSRGCNFKCSYCSVGNMSTEARYRSIDNVIKEIKYLLSLGIKEIHVWDECFTTNYQRVENFCKKIIKEDINFCWSCFSRVDTVDEKLLKLMKSTGCWCIFYGIESANEEQLKLINKNISLKKAEEIVKITKKIGISVRASFMIGLPGEHLMKAKKTIDFAVKLNPDYAQFCYTTPFPGTLLHKQHKKYGVLDAKFKNYSLWDPVFIPFGYKEKEDLIKVRKYAFRKFYLRPKYILNHLLSIRSYDDLTRLLKGSYFLLNYL
ncbi:MAG: radical SAM protein [Nanoarchaeota archaeon]